MGLSGLAVVITSNGGVYRLLTGTVMTQNYNYNSFTLS